MHPFNVQGRSSGEPQSAACRESSADAPRLGSGIALSSGETVPRWRLWLWKRPRLHGLLLECRNFFHRIRTVWTSNGSLSIDTGPTWLEDGSGLLLLNTRRCGRIQSIESFAATHPMATAY